MGRISPFAKFVASAANGEGAALFDAVTPFLSASHHARMLERVVLQGVAGGGDQPVFWIRGEEPSHETQKTVREAYEFTARLLSSQPTVLISIPQQAAMSRPYCVRLADDFGCAFIPPNALEPEVFVHEIAHLCCFSGHPILDEGIAFFAERKFMQAPQFDDAPLMGLPSACRNVRTHDDLAAFPRAQQASFGRAASRIIDALVEAEIDLDMVCREVKFVEPGDQLMAILETMIGRARLEQAWGRTVQARPDVQSVKEVLAFVNGSLADEPLDQLSPFGQFLARTQVLFSNPEYDPGHVAFAHQHSDWRNSGAACEPARGADQAVAELYAKVDQAMGCPDDPGELWAQSYMHLVTSLARYPDDPLLAAAALIYLAKTQLPEIPCAPTIDALSRRWQDDDIFGPAFANLRERIL